MLRFFRAQREALFPASVLCFPAIDPLSSYTLTPPRLDRRYIPRFPIFSIYTKKNSKLPFLDLRSIPINYTFENRKG